MSRCPHCRIYFREPEGECGDHECPKCGVGPGDEPDDDEDEEVDTEVFDDLESQLDHLLELGGEG